MATRTVDLGSVIGPQGPAGPAGTTDASKITTGILAITHGGTGNNSGYVRAGQESGTTIGTKATAEGVKTTASGNYAHAEGSGTTARGYCAHAEGVNTTASGNYAHAEGALTAASGPYAHAEGNATTASGPYAHAEGVTTTASGECAHAEGSDTTASNFSAHACGKYNKSMATGGSYENKVGDAFVIGNGVFYYDEDYGEDVASASNAFRVTFGGAVYGLSSFHSSGADYAEYFEWTDANADGEDRVGYFVTMDGKKIKIAAPGDFILGIVSGNPCIIGNADEDWLGRWVHDDFDRFVKEYLEESEVEVTLPKDLDEDGLAQWLVKNHVAERDGGYYKKTSKVVDHEAPSWRHKANPDYDPTQQYIERKDRIEWDAVGMMGVLAVRDDGTCQVNGFCKVAQGGIATAADGELTIADGKIQKGYRVLERVSKNVVKVVFR